MVKFNHPLSDYDAIVGIDLASQKSGIAVYDLHTREFVELIPVTVKNSEQEKELSLFNQLKGVFERLVHDYGKVLVIEERCPSQAGMRSTAQTLQVLMGAHWIMRLVVAMTDGAERYDEHGIHSTSVKSLFKTQSCPQPQKGDIRKAVVEMYHLDDTKLTDDISDAVAVVHTLLTKKWNADIDDRIKEIKKAVKSLRAAHAIAAHQTEMQRLLTLKI